MKKDLPIYDIKLTDDTQGVGFISLVDEPAIGVDWIKLAKVTIKEPKVVKSMMAKRALGTLDGSGCFGCPPNGDGTKANGEPDARCKGDGSGKTGGKGAGKTSTPKSPTKAPQTEVTKDAKSFIEDKIANVKRDVEYSRTVTYNKITVGSLPDHSMTEPIKVSAGDIAHINDKIKNEVDDQGRKMYQTRTLSDGSIGVFRNNGRTQSPSLDGGSGIYHFRPMMVIDGDTIRTVKPTILDLGSKKLVSKYEWSGSTNPRMKHLFDLLN